MLKNNKRFLACFLSLALTLSIAPLTAVKADALTDNILNSKTDRIHGKNRYETSAKIAEKGWVTSDYALIVNGENYSDALCSIPLAKKYDAPLLLTSKDGLTEEVLVQLKKLKVKHVYIIGGTASISENVETQIKDIAINDMERIYESNTEEILINQ